MNWKHWRIGQKLFSGFLTVVAVLIVVGGLGWWHVTNMQQAAITVRHTLPLADAAMEMNLAKTNNQVMIMEMIESSNQSESDEVWAEVDSFAESFVLYQEAILKGGDTPMGYIWQTNDMELKAAVNEVTSIHNKVFVPGIRDAMIELAEDMLFSRTSKTN